MDMKKALDQLKKEKGLTQIKMAELTNINLHTISSWRTGRTSPSMDTLTAFCDKLDVRVFEFVFWGCKECTK